MYTKPLVLAALFANSQAKTTINSTEVELIFEGILKGAFDVEISGKNSCLKDIEGISGDAKHAIDDFEKGDASHVIDGIKEVGKIIQLIKSAMSDCTHFEVEQ